MNSILPRPPFRPKDWYWKVNGSTTQVYSSASDSYVAVTNPAYVAWLAAGSLPTSIASEAELGEVLAQHLLRPASASILDGYQESHAKRLTVEIVAKVLFSLVNEVRVLKGQSALNAAQFKAYLKGLM